MNFRTYFRLFHNLLLYSFASLLINLFFSSAFLDIMIPRFQNYSKLDLERIIKEHGGRFFQHHEAQPNMYILADTTSSKIYYVISSQLLFISICQKKKF